MRTTFSKKEVEILNVRIKELEKKAKKFFGGDEAEMELVQMQNRLSNVKRKVQSLEEDIFSPQRPIPEGQKPASPINRSALMKLLLDAGADIQAKDDIGVTPLLSAAFEGDIDAVELLIARKADINAKNKFGWTGLIIAKATGNKAMENLLISEGASLEGRDQNTIYRLANSLERLQRAEKRKLKSKKRKRK